MCVHVRFVSDGEKAVLGVGGDPDSPLHVDVHGVHHTHRTVFHPETSGH